MRSVSQALYYVLYDVLVCRGRSGVMGGWTVSV